MARRVHITVRGVVQGVGFRPYVHGLAQRLGLAGFVANDERGVEIQVEGPPDAVADFLENMRACPPPLARIQMLTSKDIPARNEKQFNIVASRHDGKKQALISPDVATCDECLAELRDPADRRHAYAFINCTQCGPRYSIMRGVPYDRVNTTMSSFEMCPACRAEYENPADRRFHAQPVCCPECGPRLRCLDAAGAAFSNTDPVAEAVRVIQAGGIVAVKGIGGFHLACDASNPEAVRRLRGRKRRDAKPFAVMARDLEAARRLCQIPPEAEAGLCSKERPILLMKKRPGHRLAHEIAPASARFGVMLPYAPIHYLLFDAPFEALVMTSGNVSDEPIAYRNEDALERLAGLADAFLLHNRDIHVRTDDSVAQIAAGKLRFLRRSRGYAPFPVTLPVRATNAPILAVGAELSNTICITRAGQAYLSHHLGDLYNLTAYEAFLQAVEQMQDLLGVQPETVACDMHPSYATTRYARECGLPLRPVQHHHAHIASVLAETQRTDAVIGVAFDGLGWGGDGTLWGGEFLLCDLAAYSRAGSLEPVPQPGGDAAAREPAKMACAYLWKAFGEEAPNMAQQLLPSLDPTQAGLIFQLVERGLHSPLTSSAGRLFDAASALLGVCCVNSYHARAPMELEAEAWEAPAEDAFYPVEIFRAEDRLVARASDIIRKVVEDFLSGASKPACAARFHNTLARLVAEMCKKIREESAVATAAVSGGVFANAFLLERTVTLLEEEGFEVLLNEQAPAGDGGVCLGQAAVAAWRDSCA